MNFINEYKKGQAESNKGLYMGKGLETIYKHIGGIQKKRIYGVASAPKIGKSTLVDYAFLVSPFLEHSNIEWIYYSFEIDRVSKEFDIATFFLYHDFGISHIKLEDTTYQGKDTIELSPDYLRGRIIDDKGNIIKVKDNVFEALKQVYENRIIPLFGEWSENGIQLRKGRVTFIEEKINPTGLYKQLIHHANKSGTFIKSKTIFNEFMTSGYKKTSNQDIYTIVIIDHLRKLKVERGFNLKQTIDKMCEYMVELRNWCEYIFVPIIHTNRNLTDYVKHGITDIYPTGDDIKDSGNLSEDADYLFTMFNPNDDKYKLSTYFDMKIKDNKGIPFYPNLRTIHLVESRHSYFPKHFKVNMFGNIKSFEAINNI